MQRTKGIDGMGENINQRMQNTARIVYVDDAKLDAEIERLAFSRDEGAK